MPEETRYNLEEIGTAAHLMVEAVDKASHDLEATVKVSTEHLQAFNKTLTKNFAQQLAKLSENALRVSDKGVEELEARKEDFVERLLELEQTELETLVRVGKEIRQELDQSLRSAIENISELVEEQISILQPLNLNEHENFSALVDRGAQALQKVAKEGSVSINDKQTFFAKDLSDKMEKFENSATDILDETRQRLLEKMKSNKDLLTERVDRAKNALSDFSEKSKEESEQKTQAGADSLSIASQQMIKRLGDEVSDWQTEMGQLTGNFKQILSSDSDSFNAVHKTKIERQVEEVKSEIQTIGAEAQGRLLASHKLFQGGLRRLEKRYDERLDKLLQQFESALNQETKILGSSLRSNLPIQSSNELKDMLNTRLKARGLEIVKAFKRQIELFDLEHARFSAGCSERIEVVNAGAKDSIEQQLKSMNAEIERMLRSFRVELSQLQLQLPQVKDAGHAAALAVVAYKRARLDW